MKMPLPHRIRLRKNFSKITTPIAIPYLLEVQIKSYENFLQKDITNVKKRKVQGLEEVFRQIFPIKSQYEMFELRYDSYILEEPKYNINECFKKSLTYASPLRLKLEFVVKDKTDNKTLEIKEEEIYFGEIPLMTENGSFIINGTERVVVSQLHRSPGVVFSTEKLKTGLQRTIFSSRIIPYRGSWLDFEFDHRDYLFARIDRKKKMYASYILRALAESEEEILNYFYRKQKIWIEDKDKYYISYFPEFLQGLKNEMIVRDPKTGEVAEVFTRGKKIKNFLKKKYIWDEMPIEEAEGKKAAVDSRMKVRRKRTGQVFIQAGEVITKEHIEKAKEQKLKKIKVMKFDRFEAVKDDLMGKVASRDHIHPETGEVIFAVNEELDEKILDELIEAGIKEVDVLYIDNYYVGPYLRNTLKVDKCATAEEALLEIYKKMRPGNPENLDAARNLFNEMFFDPSRYDLTEVGRRRINYKLSSNFPDEQRTLTKEDIFDTVKYLLEFRDGRGKVDDIDHLGNRRIRSVGELVENQFRIGMVRLEKAVTEKLNSFDEPTAQASMVHDIVNTKPIAQVLKEFFGSSQLSQFMDQVNPLAETTHKRRLSALGPGGLTRERAGFEVRDVHATHYGRICPIETPEGPNIGLISSLTTYARVDKYGFIETPYRIVEDGVVTDKIEYFTALDEEDNIIAQANAPIDEKGNFINDIVACRHNGEFYLEKDKSRINLMDVSPNQIVSVAASLIPFLEHDDANRALMGSNMQRQAVPLMNTEAPLVGTGMEKYVARDSGVTVVAKRTGFVEYVDSDKIVIRVDNENDDDIDIGVDIYSLKKFTRSNQDTTQNQRPIVRKGDFVKANEVIADGAATEKGELALGRNIVIAFMPWRGYNYEDAILVSEKLAKEDAFTSLHVEEHTVSVRETKLGPEQITVDIPGLSEESLKNLDDDGIIRIGAKVNQVIFL